MDTSKNTRRQFIKTAAIGTATLAASGTMVAHYLPQREKDKLGVALVGLGYYSTQVLAPALQLTQHCYLAGIVTGTPSKAQKWKKQYQIPEANIYNYDNFDTIANNPDIDVIYIVLPPSMHSEYCIRAANAGKHVWCEKPMARTVAECQAAIDACRKNKVQLTIGYRMQHEPNTQQVIQFAQSKPYGDIRLIQVAAGYYDGRTNHWKQQKIMGGGSMYDMGVYPLNAARYVTGEDPISVQASQHTNRPDVYHEVDETTLFTLQFPSGAVAQCATSFGMSMNHLRVTTSKGWYSLEPFQAYNGVQGQTSDGTLLNKPIQNQQSRQMDDDALAIINKKAPLVPGEEGLKDIKIVEAIYKSAQTGAIVSLT